MVKERIENVRIFELNVIETNHATRKGTPAKERRRINDCDIILPAIPTVVDFQRMLSSYFKTINDQEDNLRVLSKIFKSDQYFKIGDPNRDLQKNIIQNMFDGLRYSAPLLKNITSLRVPVAGENQELRS